MIGAALRVTQPSDGEERRRVDGHPGCAWRRALRAEENSCGYRQDHSTERLQGIQDQAISEIRVAAEGAPADGPYVMPSGHRHKGAIDASTHQNSIHQACSKNDGNGAENPLPRLRKNLALRNGCPFFGGLELAFVLSACSCELTWLKRSRKKEANEWNCCRTLPSRET